MKLKRLLMAVPLLLLLAGCAVMDPVHVELGYEPGEELLEASHVKAGVVDTSIARVDIADDRNDKEGLGRTDAPIYGTGVVEWVRDGIYSLSRLGYSFPSPDEQEGLLQGRSLQVSIKRVSCRGAYKHMRCTVLLDVAFLSKGALIQQKSYYGAKLDDKFFIGPNLSHFGEEAIMRGLNMALDEVLVKLEPDLRAFCTGKISIAKEPSAVVR